MYFVKVGFYCLMCVRGAEILEKHGLQRPVSYFRNTQVQ